MTIIDVKKVLQRTRVTAPEALEKIADKVQTLTVHNGTKALLEDIVSLGRSKGAVERKA